MTATPLTPEPYGVAWLRELCDKAGKGVLNNIDARCVWRSIAGLLATIDAQASENERLKASLAVVVEALTKIKNMRRLGEAADVARDALAQLPPQGDTP